MDIRVHPGRLSGTVPAISAKADAHRLLIAAALSADAPTLRLNHLSRDIRATVECLRAMGAQITEKTDADGTVLTIGSIDRALHAPQLHAQESGSTARFLLPLAAALYDQATVTGEGSLPTRPFALLTAAMREHGVQIDRDFLPITTSGRLPAGTYYIAGNVSSQYITGLLFALSVLPDDSDIVLTSPLESRGYIEMTCRTIRKFGVEITPTETGYHVRGGQQYLAPPKLTCEGDWSNAAFWLTAGALGEEVSVRGVCGDSAQGDRAIADLLHAFGAETIREQNSLTVRARPLSAIDIHAADIPDLVPVLAVAACAAEGETVIHHAERLRLKESDRLETTARALGALGADIRVTGDGLRIRGVGRLRGGEASGENDHRIVMALAVAASISDHPVIIRGAEAVEKSYPRFFTDFQSLGGKCDVI